MSKNINLSNIFSYHPPVGNQTDRYVMIRDMGHDFTNRILANSPKCRERDVAIEKIREAVMWANAAIACNE